MSKFYWTTTCSLHGLRLKNRHLGGKLQIKCRLLNFRVQAKIAMRDNDTHRPPHSFLLISTETTESLKTKFRMKNKNLRILYLRYPNVELSFIFWWHHARYLQRITNSSGHRRVWTKEVLCLRWNEPHLRAYFETLMTHL